MKVEEQCDYIIKLSGDEKRLLERIIEFANNNQGTLQDHGFSIGWSEKELLKDMVSDICKRHR